MEAMEGGMDKLIAGVVQLRTNHRSCTRLAHACYWPAFRPLTITTPPMPPGQGGLT